jgi:signal transduction histidine kinase
MVLWSMAAAAAVLLGLLHLFAWSMDRRSRGNLCFAFVAFSIAAIVPTELGSMYARSPEEWAWWVRWCQVPIYFTIVGEIVFVLVYFGTGRVWLAGVVIALRTLILFMNFVLEPNFNFERVDSIDRTPFMGETISVVGDAVTRSWQWLAVLANLLFTVFVMDATIALWRHGDRDSRRRAAVVGGSMLSFVVISVGLTQLMIWGHLRLPIMIALPFALILCAMAFELSRDIVRAPRLARELAESERRLELAANAGGLGLWSWDIRAGVLWSTAKARELFAIDDERQARDPARWNERVHADDAARVRGAIDALLEEGRNYEIEHRVRLPGDIVRWIAVRGKLERDGSGRPLLLRGVLRDVTSLRIAQEESRELRSNLAHAGRVSMLGQLASALAHELSQPLAAILRNSEAAEMMLRGSAPDLEELRAIVRDINCDDRRAAVVISRMKDLLKRRHLDFESIAVDGLVREVSTLVRPDAVAKRVTIECAIESGLPPVSGDRVHLSQVLINLIINGMDSIAEAAGRSPGIVRVAARPGSEHAVELAVIDTGAGISPVTLPRLFEPFFTTKSHGMGMGLAVSRTIVEAHGGRFWAENNPGGGATFRFTIPAAEAA